MAKLIKLELIKSSYNVGKGVIGDPIRNNLQIFSTNGDLLLEYDVCEEKFITQKPFLDLIYKQ